MSEIYDKTINEIIKERNELIAKNEALVKGKDLKLNQFIDAELLLEIYEYASQMTIFDKARERSATHSQLKDTKIKCLKSSLHFCQSALDNPESEYPYFESVNRKFLEINKKKQNKKENK